MKFVRSIIGWICTVIVIALFGGVFAINVMHAERDKNGEITGVKYD